MRNLVLASLILAIYAPLNFSQWSTVFSDMDNLPARTRLIGLPGAIFFMTRWKILLLPINMRIVVLIFTG